MPVSAALRDRVRAFLEPDDEIRYVFPAQISNYGVPAMPTPAVIVVIGTRAITILSTGYWSRNRPKGKLATYSRDQRIELLDTGTEPTFHLYGFDFEVDDEYIPVINAVNAERDQGLPPDPRPEL